jgi:hypothetical protein
MGVRPAIPPFLLRVIRIENLKNCEIPGLKLITCAISDKGFQRVIDPLVGIFRGQSPINGIYGMVFELFPGENLAIVWGN